MDFSLSPTMGLAMKFTLARWSWPTQPWLCPQRKRHPTKVRPHHALDLKSHYWRPQSYSWRRCSWLVRWVQARRSPGSQGRLPQTTWSLQHPRPWSSKPSAPSHNQTAHERDLRCHDFHSSKHLEEATYSCGYDSWSPRGRSLGDTFWRRLKNRVHQICKYLITLHTVSLD